MLSKQFILIVTANTDRTHCQRMVCPMSPRDAFQILLQRSICVYSGKLQIKLVSGEAGRNWNIHREVNISASRRCGRPGRILRRTRCPFCLPSVFYNLYIHIYSLCTEITGAEIIDETTTSSLSEILISRQSRGRVCLALHALSRISDDGITIPFVFWQTLSTVPTFLPFVFSSL